MASQNTPAPTAVPALRVRDLRKTYDNGTQALKGVSLDVAPGDFFALLGPNGAGKSTLIGIISSLVNLSEGQVEVFGSDLVRNRSATMGMTAVYVTHDQAEAMALATRVAVMDAGEVVQYAPPMEVYRRPATTFVANFVGSPPMNLLPVEAMIADGALHLKADRISVAPLPVSRSVAAALKGNGKLTLGIRPEHLSIARGAEANAITGPLFANENMGPEKLVTLERDDAARFTARIFADDVISLGKTVTLGFSSEHIHLFDVAGARLPMILAGLAQRGITGQRLQVGQLTAVTDAHRRRHQACLDALPDEIEQLLHGVVEALDLGHRAGLAAVAMLVAAFFAQSPSGLPKEVRIALAAFSLLSATASYLLIKRIPYSFLLVGISSVAFAASLWAFGAPTSLVLLLAIPAALLSVASFVLQGRVDGIDHPD